LGAGVGWWTQSGYPSHTMGPAVCAKRAVNGLQTTLQGEAGHLVTVIDDWEQLHTNVTLLKPAKHCHSLIRTLQGHKKAVWKSRPGYLHNYSVVISG